MGAIVLTALPLPHLDVDHSIDEVDSSCVLYLPLHKLPGNTFYSRDKNFHRVTNAGSLYIPQGRSFDGTDDVLDCGNAGDIAALTGDITIIIWGVRNNNADDAGNPISTHEGKTDFTRPYAFRAGPNPNSMRFFMGGGGANQTAVVVSAATTPRKWYHWTGLIQGTNMMGFENGVRSNDERTFAGTRQTGTKVTVGQSSTTLGDRPFNGLLGIVRIYNRALSPKEIFQDYLATKWRYR